MLMEQSVITISKILAAMARYKNIKRTASVRHAVKFWWNIVKNYDERVYDQDFFDLIAYNLKRDEVAAIIRGNFSQKELKPLVDAKEESLELNRDNIGFMLKRIWKEKPLGSRCARFTRLPVRLTSPGSSSRTTCQP